MFKELYTKANNQIDTKEPYARMMAKLEKAPKRISVVKKVEYAAALAACVCLTFVGVKVYNQEKISDNPIKNVQKITWQDSSDITPEVTQQVENSPVVEPEGKKTEAAETSAPKEREAKVHTPTPKPEAPAATKVPEAAYESVITTQSPVEAAPSEEAREDASRKQVQESDAAKVGISDDAVVVDETVEVHNEAEAVPMMANILTDNEPEVAVEESSVSASGGGGGSGRMSMRDSKEMTFKEYCDYMGNIPSMPSGYKRVSADSSEFSLEEEGELADDRWTIVYENGEKRAEVVMTKELSDASHYLDRYEAVMIAGVKTVVLSEAQEHIAYFINGSIAYEINGFNMDLSELESIISELVK